MGWLKNQNVLVPVDFSDASREAVEVALTIAAQPNHVRLIHVAPVLSTAEFGVPFVDASDVDRRQHVKARFHREFSECKYQDLAFTVEFGDPGSHIVEAAQQHGVGLIVMPSHGRTGTKRLLLGSVAERVVRLAHCPVLVLRGYEA